MDSHKKIIVAVLFMLACSSPDVLADDQNSDNHHTQEMQNEPGTYLDQISLRDMLRDKERWQILLQDNKRIHGMLQHSELRQQMLQHPCFMRQMMQVRDLRRELILNEQMMHEMLRNRDIHREINRNQKMVEEIDKNESYRKINQEQQAEILEELLDSTESGASSHTP